MVASPAERALAAVSEERVLGLLRRLVDVPSPTGDERACAEALAEHLGGVGVPADLSASGPPGERARAGARAGRRRALDVLRPPGHGRLSRPGPRFRPARAAAERRRSAALIRGGRHRVRARRVQHEGRRGRGRGGPDPALVESGAALAGDVLLGAVAGESEKAPVRGALGDWTGAPYEGGGIGAEWLLQHSQRPDAVVICEPSDCHVVNARPGYLAVKVSLHGRSAYMASKGPHDHGLTPSSSPTAWCRRSATGSRTTVKRMRSTAGWARCTRRSRSVPSRAAGRSSPDTRRASATSTSTCASAAARRPGRAGGAGGGRTRGRRHEPGGEPHAGGVRQQHPRRLDAARPPADAGGPARPPYGDGQRAGTLSRRGPGARRRW